MTDHTTRLSALLRLLVLVAASVAVLGALGAGPAAAATGASNPANLGLDDRRAEAGAQVQGLYTPFWQVVRGIGSDWPYLAENDNLILDNETMLRPGDLVQTGKARLLMQHDGNLVVYDENGGVRWALNLLGPRPVPGSYTRFQADGNLVVYTRPGGVVWASNTVCVGCAFQLAVQADGNVVIYRANWTPRWDTDTGH